LTAETQRIDRSDFLHCMSFLDATPMTMTKTCFRCDRLSLCIAVSRHQSRCCAVVMCSLLCMQVKEFPCRCLMVFCLLLLVTEGESVCVCVIATVAAVDDDKARAEEAIGLRNPLFICSFPHCISLDFLCCSESERNNLLQIYLEYYTLHTLLCFIGEQR